ncbi:hypothetical protein FBU30_007757 [Linnemannia zychae]|nr:hypothetical protein FBU30_007757 [Linnemannia zychae]
MLSAANMLTSMSQQHSIQTSQPGPTPIKNVPTPVLEQFFPKNIAPPVLCTALPTFTSPLRFNSTAQLAQCNYLLSLYESAKAVLDPSQESLIRSIIDDGLEKDQIRGMACRVVEELAADNLKTSVAIAETLLLAPYLDKEHYRKLLNIVIAEFEEAKLLDDNLLYGMIQITQAAEPDYLLPDDLTRILAILRVRLENTHQQSTLNMINLTLALSRLLDVMVEGKVMDLNRVLVQEPLTALLKGLADHSDLYLKHQATYAIQGLLYIPNDETRRQVILRHAGNIAKGLLGVASVCKLELEGITDSLGQLKDAAMSVYEIGSEAMSGAQTVIEGGQGLLDILKGGPESGGRKIWYAALREAQEHIKNGRLADFNRVVIEAPCCRDVEFQWGICRILGEIAVDPLWDTTTRQQAVRFLAELYKNDTIHNPKDEDIDKWILDILRRIVDLSDKSVSSNAQQQLQDLGKVGNADRQAIYNDCMKGLVSSHPLQARFPIPSSSPLLDRVQVAPNVERYLYKLKLQRLMERENTLYIPPQARSTLQPSDEALFLLMEKAFEFLDSHRMVLLVLGDSGAGKSTFNLELERTLWGNYKAYKAIPLYINLPTIEDPAQDLIEKQLLSYNFSKDQIQELKLFRDFILICDGYDESQLKVNLHTTNQFNQPGQWRVKMVVSCRSQYLGADYRSRFQPESTNHYARKTPDLMIEAVIAPFTGAQIEQYVEQYVKLSTRNTIRSRPVWTKEEYLNSLWTIPKLIELVSNPFLLTLSLEALPEVVQSKKNLSSIRLTRVQLYDGFIKQWLEVNKARLEDNPLSEDEQLELDLLMEDGFFMNGIQFQKDLAMAIFKEQDGNPVVQYTHLRDGKTWKVHFFSPWGRAKLLRESSPVTRSGNYFRFIHRSLLEYFYSRNVYDPLDYDNSDADQLQTTMTNAKDKLKQGSFTKEPSVLQFLAERVESNSVFKAQLLDTVEDSKKAQTSSEIQVAAANAMSILVRAGVQFNSANLKGIAISGADLRGGQFDNANLEGADLTNVNLSKAWLRQAKFNKAKMDGVQFGERPYIQIGIWVSRCAFTNDGKVIAVSTVDDIICVFDTTTYEMIGEYGGRPAIAISPTVYEIAKGGFGGTVEVSDVITGERRIVLKGHGAVVTWIAYSSDGTQIATASADNTVRIWSAATGETLHVLGGHEDGVCCVEFSPNGLRVSSGSEDMTMRTWDARTGKIMAVKEFDEPIFALAYSPDGRYLVASGAGNHISVTNAETGETMRVLKGHTTSILDVSFSPDGHQLASCDKNSSVRIWNIHTGECLNTLSGHQFRVSTVIYSPVGDCIASGAWDGTVRLWTAGDAAARSDAETDGRYEDSKIAEISEDGTMLVTSHSDFSIQFRDILTGETQTVLKGHTDILLDILYSPCCKWIASAGHDRKIRLWCARTGDALKVFEGHSGAIGAIGVLAFSHDSIQLASVSEDDTLRLWNVESGQQRLVLRGHTALIGDVVFSPDDSQIATCSDDKTIRIWSTLKGEILSVFEHSSIPRQVIYFPDGKELLTIQADEEVPRCWDIATGKQVEHRLKEVKNGGHVWNLSPDGKYLVAARSDGVLSLWVYKWGQFYEVNRTVAGLIFRIRWRQTPSGELLMSTMGVGVLRVWKIVEVGRVIELYLYSSIGSNALSLEEADIKDAVGLSLANRDLIKQRGLGSYA